MLCYQVTPWFLANSHSKSLSYFVYTNDRIWSVSLLVEEPIKLHNSSYTVFIYIYIYIYNALQNKLSLIYFCQENVMDNDGCPFVILKWIGYYINYKDFNDSYSQWKRNSCESYKCCDRVEVVRRLDLKILAWLLDQRLHL